MADGGHEGYEDYEGYEGYEDYEDYAAEGGGGDEDGGGEWEYQACWDEESSAVYYLSYATDESQWDWCVPRAPAAPR